MAASGEATAAPLLLDGTRLASGRLPALARRAERVLRRRGRPPALLLVAAETRPGHAPHVERKRRACAEAGVTISTVLLPSGSTTADLREALDRGATDRTIDALFLQFPLPPVLDADAAARAIPIAKDIDLVNPANFDRFVREPAVPAPLTARALLALLVHYQVAIAGATAVIVAPIDPLSRAFRVVLDRHGAHGPPPIAPDDPGLDASLAHADVVVVAAARPGVVRSDRLPPDTTAVDAGYFNSGGRGDIDAGPGIAHLAAFAPVPGGIGPMTISMLIEATIASAEHA